MGMIRHGGDVYGAERPLEQLDFSVNVNPLGLPEGVKEAIRQSVEECRLYPDPYCRRLRAAIGEKEGVPARQILPGNGAADLIYRLVLAERPKRALVLAPTFGEYEQALRLVDCAVSHFELERENGFQVGEEILRRLDGMEMVFLCNPNNPTGVLMEQPLLWRLAAACQEKGIRCVVDECFVDFTPCPEEITLIPRLSQYPSLFVLKAFTKLYAMAGLRLGYGVCRDLALLERMESAGQPWGVSVPAQIAGIASLQEDGYVKESRVLIQVERDYLSHRLRTLGLEVYPSHANYLLFRLPRPLDLEGKLIDYDILIRSCANYRGLDASWYRVAVRTRAENDRLLAALREIFSAEAFLPNRKH